jgi:hypothetical protein
MDFPSTLRTPVNVKHFTRCQPFVFHFRPALTASHFIPPFQVVRSGKSIQTTRLIYFSFFNSFWKEHYARHNTDNFISGDCFDTIVRFEFKRILG